MLERQEMPLRFLARYKSESWYKRSVPCVHRTTAQSSVAGSPGDENSQILGCCFQLPRVSPIVASAAAPLNVAARPISRRCTSSNDMSTIISTNLSSSSSRCPPCREVWSISSGTRLLSGSGSTLRRSRAHRAVSY